MMHGPTHIKFGTNIIRIISITVYATFIIWLIKNLVHIMLHAVTFRLFRLQTNVN